MTIFSPCSSMPNAPNYFDPQPIKRDTLQFCRSLFKSIETNHTLVACCRSRKTVNINTFNLETRCSRRHLHRDSLQPHWKGPNQVLPTNLCTIQLKYTDSWFQVCYFLKRLQHPSWLLNHLETSNWLYSGGSSRCHLSRSLS